MTEDKDINFIKEIIFCIKESDVVKAKALVQYFFEISEIAQLRVIHELSRSPYDIAYPVLDYLCRIKSAHTEVNSNLYNLFLEVSYGTPERVKKHIDMKNPDNVITHLKIAGDLKLGAAVPAIINIIKSDPVKEILEQCIKTLGAIGTDQCAKTLSSFLSSQDLSIKTFGISSLSEIGNDTAVQYLASTISGESRTDQAIMDGLVMIQSQLSMDKLSEMLASPSANIRSMAIESLIKIGPKAVPSLMEQIKSEDTDLVVHTLTVLGQIGDETAVPAIQRLLYNQPKDSNVRYGAYEALGRLPSSKSSISLAAGLEDPDDQVRMAAAKAIDKNLSNVLVAGLKNMIKRGDELSKEIVAALIDSESDNVFSALIEWEEFEEIASVYLTEKAPPNIMSHYKEILQAKGKRELAEKIQTAAASQHPRGDTLQIYAVDDSVMMLKLYTKKLHEMGYQSVTFQLPAEALKMIKKSKPDLVITDLNMPNINGLQLTKEIRSYYSPAELPIIMVTTQSDFVGRSTKKASSRIDAESILKTGVDRILHKPFSDIDLASAIGELTIKK